MLSYWLRAVRIRFLLASVISVFLGIVIAWWQHSTINIEFAALTLIGVVALHGSVDLLNDYWDFKRNIDTETKRTKFSGGTGVLPEGLLKPIEVYRVGVILLIIGSSIGAYFVFERGITIAIILAFAIISIYFYSTRIVDSGLGEIFVAIKGAMIVLGTYFVQTEQITAEPIFAGIISGVLSSTVLFVNSFPDYDADRSHGRKTLVILLGRPKAASSAWIFPVITYGFVIAAILLHLFPVISILTLGGIPFIVKSCNALKQKFDQVEELVPIMRNFVSYSRITATLLVISFILDYFIKPVQ